MDDAIMQYLKRKYNLLIGERTAEAIKIQIGSAFPLDKPLTMEIKGRNLIEGVPKTLTVDDSEIRGPLATSGVRGHDHACDPGCAGTDASGAECRHQRPRNCFDRWRRNVKEFR
jgi:hypothetical protein